MHLHLHVLELIQPVLNSSNPLHRTMCLIHPIVDIPLKGVVPVGEHSSGRGPYFMVVPDNIVRMVSTTTSLILQNAALVPSVPLGSRRSLSCNLQMGIPFNLAAMLVVHKSAVQVPG
jgi:hypothetical protein